MKRIWFVGNLPGFGGVGVSWGESHGLSRNERTGRWTWYTQYVDDEGSGIATEQVETTAEMAARLCELEWPGGLVSLLSPLSQPAMVELTREVARLQSSA